MIFGKLGKYSKHKLEIETDDELDIYKISKYANGRSVSVSVTLCHSALIIILSGIIKASIHLSIIITSNRLNRT